MATVVDVKHNQITTEYTTPMYRKRVQGAVEERQRRTQWVSGHGGSLSVTPAWSGHSRELSLQER